MWRQHHYQAIVAAYDGQSQHEPQSSHAMLGVHASAWAIIHYGYIARKQNLTGVCLDSLSRSDIGTRRANMLEYLAHRLLKNRSNKLS